MQLYFYFFKDFLWGNSSIMILKYSISPPYFCISLFAPNISSFFFSGMHTWGMFYFLLALLEFLEKCYSHYYLISPYSSVLFLCLTWVHSSFLLLFEGRLFLEIFPNYVFPLHYICITLNGFLFPFSETKVVNLDFFRIPSFLT